MIDRPLISILTPSFNHEEYVGHFITSLINQTYKNWELIIVDDCSTDKNIEEIRKFTDSRIHLYIQDFNQGPGAALNKAFNKSHGDIIVDMASDDMLYPDYFEYIVKTFSNNQNVGVIYSSLDVIDENNKVYDKYQLPQNKTRVDFLKELFYKNNILFSPGMSVRREIYSSLIPMDVSMIQHQDYQWHVLLLGQTECNITDKNYVKYRFIPYNKKSLSSFNLGEYNRKRLEIDRLMDSFLSIKDIGLIHLITNSELCGELSADCNAFIWATEAITCSNFEKRQWGYKVLSKIYNTTTLREEINKKLGFDFSSYLNIGKSNAFYEINSFKKKNFRLKVSKIYHGFFSGK